MAIIPQPESRRAERIYARIPVRLLLGAEGYTAERIGTTTDVSTLGARILTEATLTPGQTMGMLSYRKGARLVSARVVWVSIARAESTQAGLEFLD